MLERGIRTYFYKKAKALGFLAYKFKSGVTGVPDEILIIPGKVAKVYFIELKRPEGGVTSERQELMHSILKRHGVSVFTVNTKEYVDRFFALLEVEKCRK